MSEKPKTHYENYIHCRATDDEVRAIEDLRVWEKERLGLLKLPSAASIVRGLIREAHAHEKARKNAASKPTN